MPRLEYQSYQSRCQRRHRDYSVEDDSHSDYMSLVQELDAFSDTSIDETGTPIVEFIEEVDAPQATTTYSSPLWGAYSDSVRDVLSLAVQIPFLMMALAVQVLMLAIQPNSYSHCDCHLLHCNQHNY